MKLESIELHNSRLLVSGEVTHVPLESIETDEKTFQWRQGWNYLEDSERHVQELARALKNRQKPLDPILVISRGAGFVVVDGHHRYEAYKGAAWDGPVPVEVFPGTPGEAELEALRRNIKDKLPMTSEDKLEAAWRLVLTEKFSKAQITEMTTIANGTIGNMRAALDKHGLDALAGMPWFDVKRLKYDLDEDFDYDQHNHRKAEKLAKEILKGCSINLASNPGILALALKMISGTLPKALVAEWYELAEELVARESEMGMRSESERRSDPLII